MRLALIPPVSTPGGLMGPFMIQTHDFVRSRPKLLELNDGDVMETKEQYVIIRRSYGVGIYEVTGWDVEDLCYSAKLLAFAKENLNVEP